MATTPSVTTKFSSVSATTTVSDLVQEDLTRKELMITNTSSAVLYVGFGILPSSTNYGVAIPTQGLFVSATTDKLIGVWASAGGGQANIVEEF